MRILITGATGFVGGHLAERMLSEGGHELHGLARAARWPNALEHLSNSVTLHSVDLNETDSVVEALRTIRPEWIFHLAGYANTGASFREPEKTWNSNWGSTFRLYEATTRWGGRPRALFTSTGLVYGNPSGGEQSCSEDAPLFPASPYAASKAAADLLSYQVTCHPGLDVVRVRCFNQFGPRQSPDYATANFARQIAAIEKGIQAPVLETGDLSGQRDLTDVRDMVRALIAVMRDGQSGEVYNGGSGTALSMRSVLDKLLALALVRIEVRERIDADRKKDTSVSRADIRKLQAATGWRPEYPLDETLADLLGYWRRQTTAMREGA
jgi:GDP-4-dehydro-6-deoxy-D-mannose reductase